MVFSHNSVHFTFYKEKDKWMGVYLFCAETELKLSSILENSVCYLLAASCNLLVTSI